MSGVEVTVSGGPVVAVGGGVTVVSPDSPPVVVEAGPAAVEVSSGPPVVVEATGVGPQGPPGADGDKHYVHAQAVPATTWVVAHGLNKYPAVAVADTAGTWWVGGVEYVDANTLRVKFAAAFAGTAYCN